MGLAIYDEKTPFINTNVTVPAFGTDWITLTPETGPNLRIDSVLASTNASVNQTVVLAVQSGTDYLVIATITVPAGAGYGTGPRIECLVDAAPQPVGGVVLPYQYNLAMKMAEAIPTDAKVDVVVVGGYV